MVYVFYSIFLSYTFRTCDSGNSSLAFQSTQYSYFKKLFTLAI